MQQGGLQSSRQHDGKARSIVSCTVVPKERFFVCRVRGSHCGCTQEQAAKFSFSKELNTVRFF